jgi:phosphatidylglycerophosphatase A
MKEQNLSDERLAVLFLSFGKVGFLPKAPGTFGSLATLPLIFGLNWLGCPLHIYLGIIFVFTLLAIFLTQKIQTKHHLHDPQWIVIDEVIGMMLTWAFLYGQHWIWLLVGFGLFRFFDIVKIWPANFFDRHPHGAGTILDDVVSGIYAGLILFLFMTSYNAWRMFS